MAKKPIRSARRRSNLDDPKGARRSADALVGGQRREAELRLKAAKYKAEIDPKSRRTKR